MMVRHTTYWAAQLLENPEVGSGLETKLSDPAHGEGSRIRDAQDNEVYPVRSLSLVTLDLEPL
jgi:hypothetical protein